MCNSNMCNTTATCATQPVQQQHVQHNAGDGNCGYRAMACGILEGAAGSHNAAHSLLRRMTELFEQLPMWARSIQIQHGYYIITVSPPQSLQHTQDGMPHQTCAFSCLWQCHGILASSELQDAKPLPIITETVAALRVHACVPAVCCFWCVYMHIASGGVRASVCRLPALLHRCDQL